METELPVANTLSLSHFWKGAVDLFRAPKAVFRSMSREGGYGKPIVYALLWQYVASVVALLVSFVKPLPNAWGAAGKVAALLLMPPLTIAMGFVFAAVFFVIWHLMGSTHNYQTAFRFWALLAPLGVASAVLRLVPYASLLVTVYYFYLLVSATVELHGIRPVKAWTVWGILMAVFALLLVVGGVIAAMRGRWPGARRGASFPGFPSAQGDRMAPPLPGAGMNPADAQTKMQEEMAQARAEFERMKKESQSAPAMPKPSPQKGSAKKK